MVPRPFCCLDLFVGGSQKPLTVPARFTSPDEILGAGLGPERHAQVAKLGLGENHFPVAVGLRLAAVKRPIGSELERWVELQEHRNRGSVVEAWGVKRLNPSGDGVRTSAIAVGWNVEMHLGEIRRDGFGAERTNGHGSDDFAGVNANRIEAFMEKQPPNFGS